MSHESVESRELTGSRELVITWGTWYIGIIVEAVLTIRLFWGFLVYLKASLLSVGAR